MARFRTSTSKGNTYLQFVESYRNQKGQPATRVLANLSNITKMSKEEIERLTTSFIRAAGMEDKFKKLDLESGKGYHYGSILPVMAVWHQLGLEQIINAALPSKVEIPVARIALIQTANRFSDPGSKLACFRWYYHSLFSQLKNFVQFPDVEEEQLHTFYRSLDHLCNAKDQIEKELYYRLMDYGMDNSLILYDITSTYFEGTKAGIARRGYSRDKRGDLDQIVIGLVMSRDGVPLAHHIFEGNCVDKATVKEVVSDLKERFGINKAIFVGDRGMITSSNIEHIKGHEYDYILGLHKRNRRLVDHFLPAIIMRPDKSTLEFGYSDLSAELQKIFSKKVRIIACYNPEVANKTKATREKNIARFKDLLGKTELTGDLKKVRKANDKLRSFLNRKHISKLYALDIEKMNNDKEAYRVNARKVQEAISKEEQLDGRYFIQTEVSADIDKEEINTSYKSLQKVEKAFRVVKDILDIRPIYVRKETRIRGHVMIAYFALLIESLIEKKLRQVYPESYSGEKEWIRKIKRDGDEPLSMMTLYEELDDIRLVPLQFKTSGQGPVHTSYIATKIDANVKKLLVALGIKNSMHPEKLRFTGKEVGGDGHQLVFDLGVEEL